MNLNWIVGKYINVGEKQWSVDKFVCTIAESNVSASHREFKENVWNIVTKKFEFANKNEVLYSMEYEFEYSENKFCSVALVDNRRGIKQLQIPAFFSMSLFGLLSIAEAYCRNRDSIRKEHIVSNDQSSVHRSCLIVNIDVCSLLWSTAAIEFCLRNDGYWYRLPENMSVIVGSMSAFCDDCDQSSWRCTYTLGDELNRLIQFIFQRKTSFEDWCSEIDEIIVMSDCNYGNISACHVRFVNSYSEIVKPKETLEYVDSEKFESWRNVLKCIGVRMEQSSQMKSEEFNGDRVVIVNDVVESVLPCAFAVTSEASSCRIIGFTGLDADAQSRWLLFTASCLMFMPGKKLLGNEAMSIMFKPNASLSGVVMAAAEVWINWIASQRNVCDICLRSLFLLKDTELIGNVEFALTNEELALIASGGVKDEVSITWIKPLDGRVNVSCLVNSVLNWMEKHE